MKRLLVVTAALELGAGVALLCFPSLALWLLLGTPIETRTAFTLARFGGAALLTIVIACWSARGDAHSRAAKGVVDAMTFYNIATVIVLAYAGIGLGLRGVVLWPAVIIHIAMAAWCVLYSRGKPTATERA